MNRYLDVAPGVALALRENRPVVALESTIISHGMPYPENVETALAAEEAVRAKLDIGLSGGMLVTNPVPEAYGMDRDEIGAVIAAAVAEADRPGVHGKALTPFLLGRIRKITGGRSLETNIALVPNNVRLGAKIAEALCR